MLAEAGRTVELATASFHVGQKLEIQNITYFYRRALAAGVRFTAVAQIVRVDGPSATLRNPFTGADTRAGPFDTIVVASAGRPQSAFGDELLGFGVTARVIGDAYAPRDAEAAILEGWEAGSAI